MWAVKIQNVRVVNKFKSFVYDAIHGAKIGTYWIGRDRFTENAFDLVAWKNIKQAMKESKISRRQWVTKFASGVCGTGVTMKRWNKRLNSKCPRCGQDEEDTTHILQCRGEGVDQLWDEEIIEMEEWMRGNLTCPDIMVSIISRIKTWRTKNEHDELEDSRFEGVNEARNYQNRIGWGIMLEGCATHRWATAQQKYYEWIGSKKSGNRWMTNLIKKLWNISWNVWDHRNSKMHDEDNVVKDEEISLLDEAIKQEWELGCLILPPLIQRYYRTNVEIVLAYNMKRKKDWFSVVRSSRERKGKIYTDIFKNNEGGMRKWVGLRIKK